MTCEACRAHAESPTSGLVNANCRDCRLREIASGPHFMASIGRSLTPHYRLQLRELGDEKDVHEEVKRVAKTVYTGARG